MTDSTELRSSVLLGTTGPASVYEQIDGSWVQIDSDLVGDDGTVTDITIHDGTLFAATTTDPSMGSGTGRVYAHRDDGWVVVGTGLDDEVTSLVTYRGELYAGTSYRGAHLYRYDSPDNWTKVLDVSYWHGVSAAVVWNDRLYIGDSLYDMFGYYDGDGFTHEADRGGSCIYDFEAYDGDLYASAYAGILYKRNGGSWDPIESVGYKGVFELETYDGNLYLGDEEGNLLWFDEANNDAEPVESFDDSVVALAVSDELYVGTGQNAAEYEGSWRDGGIATVYRYDSDTGSASRVSGVDQFGDAAQVLTTIDRGQQCQEVRGSMTTLTFIPGENENEDPLSSATMQVLPESDLVPGTPLFDSWFTGDAKEELETDLEAATEQTKQLEEFPDDPMRHYRHKDEVEVSFDTCDGKQIEDGSVEIIFNDDLPGETPSDEVTFAGEKQSYTILEEESVNVLRDYVDEWFEGYERHRAVRMPRHWKVEQVETADGTEGVRVTSVSGSYDWYAEKLAEVLADLGTKAFLEAVLDTTIGDLTYDVIGEKLSLIIDYIIISPKVFTFQELVVLADGRRAGRLWDASVFPRHAAYLDGTKADHTQFRKGKEWSPNELFNKYQIGWMLEAQSSGMTPYETLPELYMSYLRGEVELDLDKKLPIVGGTLEDIVPNHPILTFGRDSTGEELSDAQLQTLLRDSPADPFTEDES